MLKRLLQDQDVHKIHSMHVAWFFCGSFTMRDRQENLTRLVLHFRFIKDHLGQILVSALFNTACSALPDYL